MKRYYAVIVAALMVFSIAAYANGISVLVNDEAVNFDVPPQEIDGAVMIPMRFVVEKLGASVMYDDETETISTYFLDSSGNASFIIIQIGNNKAFINEEVYQLEAVPVLVEDRTLVPVEFFEKAFSGTIDFDEQSGVLTITSATETTKQEQESDEQ